MSRYRYCFLDCADHVADFQLIECDTDGQAKIRADRLLAACSYPARVYCARKVDAPP